MKPKNQMRYFSASFVFVSVIIVPFSLVQGATTTSTLKDAIFEKGAALQALQVQKDAVAKNLEEVSKSKQGLTKELKTIDGNINYLTLSVKANALTIEKLNGDINVLGNDVASIEREITTKREGITALFAELQKQGRDTTLAIVLRNTRLSDLVSEAQSSAQLNSALVSEIHELNDLQQSTEEKYNETITKKREREYERISLTTREQLVREQKAEKQRLLENTKNQERVYAEQLSALEKLQGEISSEIEQIEAKLREGIDPSLLPFPRQGVLGSPVKNSRITQGYGATAFALRTYKGKYHNGLDYGGPIGTEILAAEDGVVINVGNQDAYRGCYRAGYGKFIVVKHENNLTTLYAHLSAQIVKIGQKVTRGELIGYMGRTGWATGPHLHFTLFASQTLTPARPGYPEGTKPSRVCGPMPVGGDLDPSKYVL